MSRALVLFAMGAATLAAGPSLATEEMSQDRLVVQAKIPKQGDVMEYAFNSLWTMSLDKLVRINGADNSVTVIDVKGSGGYRPPAAGEGALWLADVDNSKLFKIDPATNAIALQIPLDMMFWQSTIGVGYGSVWVATGSGGLDKILTRLKAADGSVEATITLPSAATEIIVAFNSVWVVGNGADALYRIDPKTNSLVGATKLHKKPLYICSEADSLWVFNQGDGMVDRIDPKTGEVIATIDTGFPSIHGGDFACGGGYVWGDQPGTPLVQIDPKTNQTVRRFSGTKGLGWSLRYGDGSLWFSGPAIVRVEPPS